MKRNFPKYAVGLDSTLDAIRKLDYERGMEDAAQIAEGITAHTIHQSRHWYRAAAAIAYAIRAKIDKAQTPGQTAPKEQRTPASETERYNEEQQAMVENATEAKVLTLKERSSFGPCSCADSGKCIYIDGSPACMAPGT